MRRLFLPSAIVLVILLNTAPGADEIASGDLVKFQGHWKITSRRSGTLSALSVWTIKGNDLKFETMLANGDKIGGTCKLKVDDRAKPHKTVDSTNFTRYGGITKGVDRTLAIYEFVDKDTIRMCNSVTARPTEFKTDPAASSTLFTLVRVTEAEKEKLVANASTAMSRQAPIFVIQEFDVLPQPLLRMILLETSVVGDELKISDAQKEEFQAILQRRVQKVQQARRDSQDFFKFQAARVVLFKESDAEIRASLTPEQRERLDQIQLQVQGPYDFARPEDETIVGAGPTLLERLKLSDDQLRRCRAIVEEGQEAIAKGARFPIGFDTKKGPPTIEEVRKLVDSPQFQATKQKARQAAIDAKSATIQRLEAVLTDKQRESYHKLLGARFVLPSLSQQGRDERLVDIRTVALAYGLGGGQRADIGFNTKVARPAYTTAARPPRVLFDEAHFNFHTAGGRYKPFADLITSDGYQIIPNREKFSREVLQKGDILVIANALGAERMGQPEASNPAFTDAECDTIRDWVKDGGALLFITDHAPMGAAVQCLAKRFDVSVSKVAVSDRMNSKGDSTHLVFTQQNHLLGDHPITRGRDASERINRVQTFTGASLKGSDKCVPFLKLADTAVDLSNNRGIPVSAKGRAQGLALSVGKGRVVILGEAAELSAQVLGPEEEKAGMNVPGLDNRQMALNIMHWLSGLLEPRESPPR